MNNSVPGSNARPRCAAFTLVEMLIVVSVIGMLLALSAPRVFSLLRSNELTTQGEGLRNWLSLAQQQALSSNAPVEVRFFKFADADESQVEPEFRAAQYYQYDRFGTLKAASQILRIKSPVFLSQDPKLSNILDTRQNKSGGKLTASQEVEALLGKGVEPGSVEYASFRFRPDGSTDLDTRPSRNSAALTWFLTMVQEGTNKPAAESENPVPRNFVCLQIDQFNGTIREFRP